MASDQDPRQAPPPEHEHIEWARHQARGAEGLPTQEDLPTPKRIGHYRIVRLIGSGGMGTVYEAEQDSPQRAVALKVIKSQFASKSSLRRFEYESQILAKLRHPAIAQIYEAGTHFDGETTVPFFAMEYVPDAKPITEYAVENGLSTRDRLQLFGQVCAAVHHGHQKGIIHRDLKPGNILVDAQGQVKIIDFGVARSTDADIALTTLRTDIGQLIGTLQYMSPEQVKADPHDLDLRSDVYALGVVLFELLSEQLPYDLRGAAIYEAGRIIREQTPTRPSTINRALRGDIETVALKALEKDRERRYQSVDEFRSDIGHFLRGEPIIARPPSVTYQVRLFARKNKALVGAVVSVFLVLVASTLLSRRQFIAADTARAEAVKANQAEVEHREIAETQRDRAVEAEQEAEAVTGFLERMITAIDPDKAEGRVVTVVEVLDQASQRIDTELAGKPALEARLRETIGQTYQALGRYKEARTHLEWAVNTRRRVYGQHSPLTLKAMNNLATLYLEYQDFGAAETVYLETADGYRAIGGNSESLLTSMYGLGVARLRQGEVADGEALLLEVLEKRRDLLGHDHIDTLLALNGLAGIQLDRGNHSKAESMYREVFQSYDKTLGREHSLTLGALNNLATVLANQGRVAQAAAHFQMVSETRSRVLGPGHPHTWLSQHNWASIVRRQGKYEEAEALASEVLAHRREAFGIKHPSTLQTMNLLARCIENRGQLSDAEALFREVLAIRQETMGDSHGATLESYNNLADCLFSQGRLDDAEKMYKDALVVSRRTHGHRHPQTLNLLNNLGTVLHRERRFTEAIEVFNQILETQTDVLGADHPKTLITMNNLANVLARQKRYDEAELLFRNAWTGAERVMGNHHPNTLRFGVNFGHFLIKLEKYEEAESLLVDAFETSAKSLGSRHRQTLMAASALGQLYDAWGKPDKAAEWRAKLPPAASQPTTTQSASATTSPRPSITTSVHPTTAASQPDVPNIP